MVYDPQSRSKGPVFFKDFDDHVKSKGLSTAFDFNYDDSAEKYESISEYLAYNINRDLMSRISEPYEINGEKYYKFMIGGARSFFAVDWRLSVLPYYMSYNESKYWRSIRDTIFNFKEIWYMNLTEVESEE